MLLRYFLCLHSTSHNVVAVVQQMGSMAGVSPTFSHMVAITVRMAHSYFLPAFMEYLPAVSHVRRVATYCLHFFAFF